MPPHHAYAEPSPDDSSAPEPGTTPLGDALELLVLLSAVTAPIRHASGGRPGVVAARRSRKVQSAVRYALERVPREDLRAAASVLGGLRAALTAASKGPALRSARRRAP